ncbi:unnamed protein product [Cunninghamella echinulata]
MPDPLSIYYKDNYLKFYVPNQSNSVDINNNNSPPPQQTNSNKKKKYSRRKTNKSTNNDNENNSINDTGHFTKPTLLRNKGKYKTLKKNRKLSINGLHHHHNQAPYYHYQNRHLSIGNHATILPNHTPFYLFSNNDLYNYQYFNDMNTTTATTTHSINNNNSNKKSRADIYSNNNNSHSNLFTPTTSTPSPPMFDKNIIDTFCFHWPEKHCYILVKILPTSIAILPIRHSRLAFLYFCYAPRPRQPSLALDSLEPHPSKRFQEVFQSWKNTLTFHDASSSSSSSTYSVSSSDELEDFKKLKIEQHHHHHKDYTPSTSTTPLSTKVNSTNSNNNNNNSNNNTNNDNNHYSIMDSTHSTDLKDNMPVFSPINMNNNNNNNKNSNQQHIDMDTTKSKSIKYHHHHPRHPSIKSQEQNNNININIHDSDDNIVTLSDVIHHQLNINSCWIHAPCQLIEEEKENNDNTHHSQDEDEDEKKNNRTSDNKFIILQSKNATLKLKARCITEKSMFINLFKLNQLTCSSQNFNPCPPPPHSISATHLLDIWQKKNQSLVEKVNDITLQVEKYKMETKFYHQKCEELEELLDNTYDALTFHKENRLGYSETKSIMVTTHKKLSYYRDQFKQVQHRLDKLGTSSSSSWILDNAFRHYERFKQFHLINHIFYHLGVSAGIGIIVVIIAIALGYYYHY